MVGIPLAKHFLKAGPLSDEVFDAMDRGRIDLLLYADDGNVPEHLARTGIFEEEFVCIVSKGSRHGRGLTLKQYLNGQHVGVATLGGSQTIPDQRLAAQGLKRRYAFRVSYFEGAICTVPGTELIATVPKRTALAVAQGSQWRVVKAPKPMESFRYLMAWHSRVESDAAHVWLRSVVQSIGQTI